jgi:putative NADH-flavin reductase
VTAVARRPAAITLHHERLEVVQGDVFEPSTFEQALAEKDVVVSSLGVVTREPTTLFSQGVANIMRAMQDAGVRRLISISAGALDPGPLWQRWIAKPLLWLLFKDGFTDMARMEGEIKESGLDWTIMRPPRLTNEPRTGRYQVAINQHLSHGWKISRADVADYIVKHLNDPETYCARVEIAY